MSRFIKKRTSKVGLPPGSLVHIGEPKTDRITISVFNYDEIHFQEKEVKTIEECFPFKDMSGVTWIDIDGVHEPEILEKLGGCFGLHSLVLEDIFNTDQRPKIEDYNDYIYIVLKMIYYNDKKGEIIAEQISLIVGPHYIISFQERRGDVFDPVRERIRRNKGNIRKFGSDYLAYSLIDAIVDNYFTVVEKLGEKIEDVEEELVTNPTTQILQSIHGLKKEMMFFRKSVWPLRDVVNSLERGESALFQKTTFVYFRDVYDHTIQIADTIETLRDMLSSMLDIYLSSISNRLNAIMKVLTIIATIFIPLTFIVGIYGMNFKYMPELEWHWGYFAVWFVIILIVVLMVVYFKKKKWL
jgi:magnesium transporter